MSQDGDCVAEYQRFSKNRMGIPRLPSGEEGDQSSREAPLVSAMMTAYNAAPYIENAIRSVVDQSLQSWELVVVDDGSLDATPDIVRRWQADPRIHLFCLPANRGRGYARNYALQRCRGEYVAICDSDDISLPERFEIQVAFLEEHPEIGVVASQVLYFSDREAPSLRVIQPENDAAIRGRMLLKKSPIPNQSAMIRRELFQRHGGYDEEFKRAQDLEFFLRIKEVTKFHTLSEPLVLYRQGARDVGFQYWMTSAFYEMLAFAQDDARERGATPPSPREFQRFSTKLRLYLREPLAFLFFHLRRRLLGRLLLRS